jgi:hypothetical protein
MTKNLTIVVILVIIFSTNLDFISAQEYQRLAHMGYTHAERTKTDYHSFRMDWCKTSTDFLEVIDTHKYYVIRGASPSSNPVNDNLRQRYAEYLMEINGVHLTKHYVAWNIVAEPCDNQNKKLTFDAKFFNRRYDALKFYQSISSTNKVRFSPSGEVEYVESNYYDLLRKSAASLCP